MAPETMLQCEQIRFSYPGGKLLFECLDATFAAGSFTLLQGSSGAGKSTLLRLLVRLEHPLAGVIRFQGSPLTAYQPAQLRKDIAYLQQTPSLIPGTVRANLLLPFTFRHNRNLVRPAEEQLRQDLNRLLLDQVRLDQPALELSIGQQQRLCLLRMLGLQPKMLLLDEPTSALDRHSRRIVEETIQDLSQRGKITVIYVSHHDFKPRIEHERMLLDQGKIRRTS